MPDEPTLLHGACECHAGHVPTLCACQGWVHPARPVSGYGGGDAAADTVTSEDWPVVPAWTEVKLCKFLCLVYSSCMPKPAWLYMHVT